MQAKVTTLTVRRGFVSSINIDYEYHVRIRNCDPNNTGLSRCVMNFLDKTIGACNLLSRQGGSGEGEEEECNVRKFKARASRIFAFKIEGYEYTR